MRRGFFSLFPCNSESPLHCMTRGAEAPAAGAEGPEARSALAGKAGKGGACGGKGRKTGQPEGGK